MMEQAIDTESYDYEYNKKLLTDGFKFPMIQQQGAKIKGKISIKSQILP